MSNPTLKLIILLAGTGISILLAAFHHTLIAGFALMISAMILTDYFRKGGKNDNDSGCASGCGSGCSGCGGCGGGGCGGCGG